MYEQWKLWKRTAILKKSYLNWTIKYWKKFDIEHCNKMGQGWRQKKISVRQDETSWRRNGWNWANLFNMLALRGKFIWRRCPKILEQSGRKTKPAYVYGDSNSTNKRMDVAEGHIVEAEEQTYIRSTKQTPSALTLDNKKGQDSPMETTLTPDSVEWLKLQCTDFRFFPRSQVTLGVKKIILFILLLNVLVHVNSLMFGWYVKL